jgi:hypothetical protein
MSQNVLFYILGPPGPPGGTRPGPPGPAPFNDDIFGTPSNKPNPSREYLPVKKGY